MRNVFDLIFTKYASPCPESSLSSSSSSQSFCCLLLFAVSSTTSPLPPLNRITGCYLVTTAPIIPSQEFIFSSRLQSKRETADDSHRPSESARSHTRVSHVWLWLRRRGRWDECGTRQQVAFFFFQETIKIKSSVHYRARSKKIKKLPRRRDTLASHLKILGASILQILFFIITSLLLRRFLISFPLFISIVQHQTLQQLRCEGCRTDVHC